MRYVNGDILTDGEYTIMIDFPRRDGRGRTDNYEFQVILIEEVDIEKGILKKGREFAHFFLHGEWKLIARTRPDLYMQDVEREFEVGYLLENQGYYKRKYEILKIENGIVEIERYASGIGYLDYTIGELNEQIKNGEFKILGMKPIIKTETPEEIRRREYVIEYNRRYEEKMEAEYNKYANRRYAPRLGDMDSFGNY